MRTRVFLHLRECGSRFSTALPTSPRLSSKYCHPLLACTALALALVPLLIQAATSPRHSHSVQ